MRPPPRPTLFPYTTLFRSVLVVRDPDHPRPAGRRTERLTTGEPLEPEHTLTAPGKRRRGRDRKSTRLNSSHVEISYAVFCLKKKKRMSRRRKSLEHRPPLP